MLALKYGDKFIQKVLIGNNINIGNDKRVISKKAAEKYA